ncbi:MAG: AAA family ATPase [Methylotenera sp.]|uniref:AAA family ATPase n=1 Tax=Methylotenera sp. TaxID=2051956 RepID=UPI0027233099|nr:AAA family ATPase [Methylotenera sp.]MDO9151919.1 AAA family ATPase [Methylotenera sp.]
MKIIVISPNKVLKEEILHSLKSADAARYSLVFDDGLNDLWQVTADEDPDLIIIDGLCVEGGGLCALENICLRYPDVSVIILSENASTEFLMAAMRSGVKDVLSLPLQISDLQAAVNRVDLKLKQTVPKSKKGKVIAFVGSKGGSGATFLACNLAYILAETSKAKVALLDLNLQFGDAVLFVNDHVPSNTLADVAKNIKRLDASLLSSSMVSILPNFSVLAAPEDAESAQDVRPEHIDALLKLTISQYDFVLIDIGRTLNATSVKALDHTDIIFIVLQETLPFIRDSKRLLHALQSLGYAKEKVKLVLNRYEKGGDIRLVDVETALDMKVFKTIPNSYQAVSASVNQGVPIIQIAKSDPVTKALQEVAENLVEGAKAKKSSWLDSLLHHASLF